MQTNIENDENTKDEKILGNIKIWVCIKNELDTELGKNSYPIEAIDTIYTQIKLDERTEYISKQRQQQYNTRTMDGDTGMVKEEPTEKQISYALKLGIEKPEQYNKHELSEKIKQKKQELGYE